MRWGKWKEREEEDQYKDKTDVIAAVMDVRLEILKSHSGTDHHGEGQSMWLVKGGINLRSCESQTSWQKYIIAKVCLSLCFLFM